MWQTSLVVCVVLAPSGSSPLRNNTWTPTIAVVCFLVKLLLSFGWPSRGIGWLRAFGRIGLKRQCEQVLGRRILAAWRAIFLTAMGYWALYAQIVTFIDLAEGVHDAGEVYEMQQLQLLQQAIAAGTASYGANVSVADIFANQSAPLPRAFFFGTRTHWWHLNM